MNSPTSAGAQFRQALAVERPLQLAGAINAYTARMATAVGFRALYLSGGGVAANSLGMPDLGISNPEDVLTDIRRITDATPTPLLVDADTGWGAAFNIARVYRMLMRLPMPYGPPTQPVFTSQQFAPYRRIFFLSKSA